MNSKGISILAGTRLSDGFVCSVGLGKIYSRDKYNIVDSGAFSAGYITVLPRDPFKYLCIEGTLLALSELIFFSQRPDGVADYEMRSESLYTSYLGRSVVYEIPEGCSFIIINSLPLGISRDNIFTESVSLRSVRPLYSRFNKQLKKEGDDIFMRAYLDTDAVYTGEDYTYLYSRGIVEGQVLYVVNGDTVNGAEVYARACFSKTDCAFNISKKTCTISLSPFDDYTKLLNTYDKEFDVIRSRPVSSRIFLDKPPCCQFYISGANTVINLIGGQWKERKLNKSINTSVYYHGGENATAMNAAYDAWEKLLSMGFINGQIFNEIHVSNCSGEYNGFNLGSLNGTYSGACPYMGRALVNGDTAVFVKTDNSDLAIRLTADGTTKVATFYRVEILNTRTGVVYYKNPDIQSYYLKHVYPQKNGGSPEYINRFVSSDNIYGKVVPVNTSIISDPKNYASLDIYFYWLFTRVLSDTYIEVGSSSAIDLNVYNRVDVSGGDIFVNRGAYKYAYDKSDIFRPGDKVSKFITSGNVIYMPTRYIRSSSGDGFFKCPKTSGDSNEVYIPLCVANWLRVSLWCTVDFNSEALDFLSTVYSRSVALRHAYSIGDIIRALLGQLGVGLKFAPSKYYSQFLFGGVYPAGLQMPLEDKGFYLYLTPLSNVSSIEYDTPAMGGKLSLKSVLDMLKRCFNCYWFIDNKELHIEHIDFFRRGYSYNIDPRVGLDLSGGAINDSLNGKDILHGQYSFEYDTDSIFSERNIRLGSDASAEAFLNNALKYKYWADTSKSENIEEPLFEPDYMGVMLYGDDFSKDSFVILSANSEGEVGSFSIPANNTGPYFVDSDNVPMPARIYNAGCSPIYTAQLLAYDVPFTGGFESSPAGLVMKSLAKYRVQILSLPFEKDLDSRLLVRTDIGDGQITEIDTSLVTFMVKLTLVYDP